MGLKWCWMDPLAYLEDGDDDDDGSEEDESAHAAKRRKLEGAVDYKSLCASGYVPEKALASSELYAAETKKKNDAAEKAKAAAEKAKAEEEARKKAAEEAFAAGWMNKKDDPDKKKETTREKNSRKQKFGQATFSLKDDRDCTNPYVNEHMKDKLQ